MREGLIQVDYNECMKGILPNCIPNEGQGEDNEREEEQTTKIG
jgi:hypothetical protein